MNATIATIGSLCSSKASPRRPWLLQIRSSTWFITVTVCTAVFTDIFLCTVIIPVFPFSLVQRSGVAQDDVQHWLSILLSTYSAGLLVAAPISGWISDRMNSRSVPLLGGMLVLGGATVMLCLAKSLPLLVIGRLLQGASAAVVWVVGLALLADTVGKEHVGQAMGYVAMAYSVAGLIAPLLGGIVYGKSGYYSVFAMAFGMIVLDIVLRLLLIEKKVAKRWMTEESPVGAEMRVNETVLAHNILAADFKCVTVARTPTASNEVSPSPEEKRTPPIVMLLKSRRMQATFCASTFVAVTITILEVTLPLVVQSTFHWDALGAGLIFLAPLLPSFFQPLYGWWVDRYGPRWIASAGLLICIPPLVCFRFVTYNSTGQKVLLSSLLVMVGLGAALALAAVMTEFTLICEEKERKHPGSMGVSGAYAQSYSLFNVSWALGSLMGSYWGGGIRQAAGFGTMGWASALLCAIVMVPTTLYVGGSIFVKGGRVSDDERRGSDNPHRP